MLPDPGDRAEYEFEPEIGGGIRRRLTVAAVVSLAGCGRGDVVSATPAASPAISCTPTASAAGQPITDPSGPYYHQTVVAQTTNGLTLANARQVLEHASVPDGMRRADGSVLVYYVNGAAGATWVARLVGDSAQAIGPITVDGVARPVGVVDPDAQLLPDGRIRLFYLNGFGAPPGQPRAMCSADSQDGVQFTTRGPAFTWTSGESLTDPSVVRLADGSWLMAMSLGQQTVMARSSDGLAFTREATLSLGGVPELALAPDGSVRLYVCGAGIVAYRSPDGGRAFTREQTVVGPGFNGRNIVCDPSLVAGAGLFVFKTG